MPPQRGSDLPYDVLRGFANISVTGGAGFVGRNLVQSLTTRGHSVRVLDIASAGNWLPEGATSVQVDLRDQHTTRAAIQGSDLVFHLAGNASGTRSVTDPRFDFETNTVGTFNVAEACTSSDARLVYMSSACVYGTPRTVPMSESHPTEPFLPYGASKLSGEHIVRTFSEAFGLSSVVARSFVVYGPGEDPETAGGEVSQFLRWHLNGLPIPVMGDVDGKTRDFIHVYDLVTALTLLAGSAVSGEVVNVGTGEETSMRQLGAVIGDAIGHATELNADTRVLDDSYRLVGDVSRLRALGFIPRMPLSVGVASLAAELGPQPQLPAVRAAFRHEQLGTTEV